MEDVQLVVIDEISMVGIDMFQYISERLKEITGCKKPFGGLHVLCVGDLFQLMPVCAAPIFAAPSTNYSELEEKHLWRDLFRVVELEEILRQKDFKKYAEMLNRLRTASLTQADLRWLRSRVISRQDPRYKLNAHHMAYLNELKDMYNTAAFNASQTETLAIKARDCTVNNRISTSSKRYYLEKAKTKNTKETFGLQHIFQIKKGLPVEVVTNVDKPDGLTNGALGILGDWELGSNGLPAVLWVDFADKEVGKETRRAYRAAGNRGSHGDCTPIQVVSRKFRITTSENSKVMRTQFPLAPATATTIHHAQGCTLPGGVLDFTSKRKLAGLHYTAFTRFPSIDDVWVLNLNENQIHCAESVKSEMRRLRNEFRIQHSADPPAAAAPTEILFAHNNVRSYPKHFEDIHNTPALTTPEVMFFTEACLPMEADPTECSTHTSTVFKGHQKHQDIVLLSKLPIPAESVEQIRMPSFNIVVYKAPSQEAYCPPVTFVCVYRSPGTPLAPFIDALYNLLMIADCSPTVLLGDFNIDLLKQTSETTQLVDRLTGLGCTQNIALATTDYNSLLDHVWANETAYVTESGTLPAYWSDHAITWGKVTSLPPSKWVSC